MPKLFEISNDILEIYEEIAEQDGELTPEMDERMTAIMAAESEKLDSIFYVIRRAEMEEAAAKAHAEQWQKKAAARRKAIEWLKNAVQTHLTATGAAKVTTPNGNTFAVQKNGGKRPLFIEPHAKPEDHPKYSKVVVEWDREAIRTILEANPGYCLEFAVLDEAGSHLRLR